MPPKDHQRLGSLDVWLLVSTWLASWLVAIALGVHAHLTYQVLQQGLQGLPNSIAFQLLLWGCSSLLIGGFLLHFKDELTQKWFHGWLGAGASILIGLLVLGLSVYRIVPCWG